MLDRFLRHLSALELERGRRAIVAVSGGPDSVVLLDLLVRGQASHDLELVVAHVDHGIAPESAAVAEDLAQLASAYSLKCVTTHLALGPETSETTAREARYVTLEEDRVRESADYIITAHHADDQAETVLLRVVHGTGPAGLAAMMPRRGRVIRPLLPFTRHEIMVYLRERGLTAWEDPANRDPRHLRSWVRTVVLPLIRQRLPDVDRALLQVARQAAEDRGAWERVIDLLPGLEWRAEVNGGSVAAAPLAGYDSTVATAVLRALGRRIGCRIGREQAQRAHQLIRASESGARFEIGNGWRLEIVFGRAQFVWSDGEGRTGANGPTLLVEGEAGDGAVGRWRLFWRHEAAPPTQRRDDLTAWFIPEELAIRPWVPGDKIHPLGGLGRRLVVRCLQDAKVPRWQRDGWPMVLDRAGEIVWVPGICRSNRLMPPVGAEALRVDAQVV